MDLSDIKLVIQWKATCNLCTLWQWSGQAAQGTDQQAIVILLVEKEDTDEELAKKAERAAKHKQKNKESIEAKRKALSKPDNP